MNNTWIIIALIAVVGAIAAYWIFATKQKPATFSGGYKEVKVFNAKGVGQLGVS